MARVTNPHVRLGRGEVATDDDTRWAARRLFLDAVVEVKSDVYWSLFPVAPGEGALQAYRARWDDDPEAMIAAWQVEWSLRDPWLADVARHTLRAGFRFAARFRDRIPGLPIAAGDPWPGRLLTPKDRGGPGQPVELSPAMLFWDPTSETEHEHLARLTRAVRAEHARIRSDVAATRTRTKTPEHFRWIARFQVLEESGQRIAATVPDKHPEKFRGVEERARAVQVAINDTKDLIGLTLRDDPYRSPKKSRPGKTS